MQLTITNSVNISVLDSKIIADLCVGNFLVDLTPSTWITSGASNVLGAKVKIINPFGVAIKDYPATGYDIIAPMTSIVTVAVPKQLKNYQYGLYQVLVQLTDVGGKTYEITDNITICEPNPLDKTKKYGNIIARITANCKQGMVTIMLDEPPVYKGKIFESKTQSYVLTYPTGSGLSPLTSTINAFSVALFPGEYLVKGDVCVTYNFGDNNFIKVPYKTNCKKNVQCMVDLCCVFDKIHSLNIRLNDCHADEVKKITDVILDSLRLIKTIELGIECGEDISDYISELDELLGCKCSCSASESTPMNTTGSPAANVLISGCNVSTSVNGLTTTYNIDNFEYIVSVNSVSQSIIAISTASLNQCTKSQQLTFNVAGAYAAIKTQIVNTTEYAYWASVLNNNLNDINLGLLSCLGFTNIAWNALTFREKFIAALTKFCGCCAGTTCNAVVSNIVCTAKGADELITWDINSDTFSSEIYIDGIFIQNVLSPLHSIVAVIPNPSVTSHIVKIIALCQNKTPGNTATLPFVNTGCAKINAISLSSNAVLAAVCPFNLTTLAGNPSAGYKYEWHNANSRTPDTLVPTPTNVSSGNYYVFNVEEATNCSSPSSYVKIVCQVSGSCTEPLNLLVSQFHANENIIEFSSASTPPASYLVKRKLASSPEVTGSYTTIGAPLFNNGTNKWEIVDTTGLQNTLYTYKAESQCSDGSRPYSVFTFARINCPTIANTPTVNSIAYSFTNTGGSIDKYEVKLFDSTGAVLLQTKTHIPAFATPITDVFTGLQQNTVYIVKVKTFIGSYSASCTVDAVTTLFQAQIGNSFQYGFTEANTLGTLMESEYVASVDAVFALNQELTGSFTPGGSILVSNFGNNSVDKVFFIQVPPGEAAFTLWSELNSLQTNRPIDQVFNLGSNVWFKSTRSGGTLYITKIQTTFTNAVTLQR